MLSYEASQRTHSTIIWELAFLSSTFGHLGNRSALAAISYWEHKGDLGNAALSSSSLRAFCYMFLRLLLATPLFKHGMGIWEMLSSPLASGLRASYQLLLRLASY